MCYQLTELYTACRCVYYIHAVDRCAAYHRRGHSVQKRTILVGYTCSSHCPSNAGSTGIVEDDISDDDNASIFSDISAPSTNLTFPDDTKQEAADRLFHELLNEFSLRHLWPQIVKISHNKDQAVRTIDRYLSRFSRDLRALATSRLNKNAARFVGASRLTVAERIVECHVNELSVLDDEEYPTKSQEPLETAIEEGEEKDDVDTDEREIIYDHVQQFIFENAPFQSFVTALKLFVSNDSGKLSEVTTSIRQSFNCLALWYWRSTKLEHQTRLSWSCVAITVSIRCMTDTDICFQRCGQKGHDDYFERRSGAIEELQVLLRDYEKMTLELVENTGSVTVKNGMANVVSLIKSTFSFSSLKGKSAKLPTFNQTAKGRNLGEPCRLSSSTQTSVLDPKHKFLVVCAPFAKRVSKAHQPDVCKIHSDRDFFKALRQTYSDSRRALRWRWFRRVSSIDFVKFEMFLSEIVNVQQCPSLPESQARIDYDFEQCDTDPPIGPNLLSHLFENPDHAEVLPVLFNRIPKKLRNRLCACPKKGSSVGWGIRFVEGLDPLAVFLCGCVGFVVSLVVSLVYTLVMDDIQGGFAIGAHMLAFFLFCGGCLHSASQ
ncbi:uncharacterized protein B0J16DRAFT_396250 [Fusarium flagelliforme]|uniref:uncharacterized protein n=1 Tax=Fusarium flagelliforme TaxID=2675880 RepID=UPI001E8EDF90|nr:uncharacterized protein B0J16DRAFT_396250 [Fusarium flagelliforme]KAH7188080.1 hypothetical protein B0J16DRAFT_396250 [Fusarium flagelliforme]